MSKNFLKFLVYLTLFQLITEVKSQETPFKPSKRVAHTATLIDGKLYILGGFSITGYPIENEIIGKEFFYLDVSEPFTIDEIKWVDLTNINSVPPHRRAASARGGINNNTLFLYGGQPNNGEMALVYIFHTQNNSWSIPQITEDNHPFNKSGLVPVIDKGKMYLFGGFLLQDLFNVNNYVDDMTILNTIDLSIEKINAANAPLSRAYYGAVLLPNQKKIIYIGGIKDGKSVPLDNVDLYDTTNDEWSNQITRGLIPSNRNAFSAVLGLDGQRVIVYGGLKASDSPIPVEESLYVLDVIKWEWYIPTVIGIPPPVSFSHKANVIGNYMVITFGNSNDNTADRNEISFLYINNNKEYKWSNIFDPDPTKVPNTVVSTSSNPTNPSNPSTPSNSSLTPAPSASPNTVTIPTNNLGVLVGAILGSLAGGIILTVGVCLLFKKRKNHQFPHVPG